MNKLLYSKLDNDTSEYVFTIAKKMYHDEYKKKLISQLKLEFVDKNIRNEPVECKKYISLSNILKIIKILQNNNMLDEDIISFINDWLLIYNIKNI